MARAGAKALSRKGVVAGPLRKAYEAGARTFSWTADDPDGDRLAYRLEVRREGEDAWFPLATGLEDTFYTWDVRGLPDGDYRVQLETQKPALWAAWTLPQTLE